MQTPAALPQCSSSNLNPFTHLAISYQEILFFPGPFGHWKWLLVIGAARSCSSSSATSCSTGCVIRSRKKCDGSRSRSSSCAGDVVGWSSCNGSIERHRIVTEGLSPLRRRRQFATLKSALLRAASCRPAARRDVQALQRRSFAVPPGSDLGVIGRNGSGKSTMLKLVAGITKPTSGHGEGQRPHLGAHRARRRVSSRDLRPRERLHQRHHARV